MGTSTNNLYPYPELVDSANVPRDMKALADAVDLSRNIPSRLPTVLGTAYPAGVSTMYVAAADSAAWPPAASCVVTTSRTPNNILVQWCAAWTATYTKVWVRSGTSTAWGPWTISADSRGAGAIARGRASITVTSSVAGNVAVTFPAGMFTVGPRVVAMVIGTSSFNAYSANGPVATGFTCAVRFTDGVAGSGTASVDWIAVENEA